MATPALSTPCPILPTQVWGRLSADRQARAVRLMAQLAFHCVTAQCDPPRKKVDHGRATRLQDPS